MKKRNSELPSNIKHDILNTKTSLGKHISLPGDDFGVKFIYDLLSERFKLVEDKFYNKFPNKNYDLFLLNNIVIEEFTHKNDLLNLANKIIHDEFNINPEIVKIQSSIGGFPNFELPEITPLDKDILLDKHIKQEIYKRRMINVLIQGGAYKYISIFYLFKNELDAINTNLYSLYDNLSTIIDFSYFIMPIGGGVFPVGKSNIQYIDNDKTTPKIITSGLVFPILVHELAKGVLELIAINGLPDMEEDVVKKILNYTDSVEFELWDLLLGVSIWEEIMSQIPYNKFHLKHHLFHDLCTLDATEFNITIKELLLRNNNGKNFINNSINKINC